MTNNEQTSTGVN